MQIDATRGRPRLTDEPKKEADRRTQVTFSAPKWLAAELDKAAHEAGQIKSEFLRQRLIEALQIQRPQF